MTNLEKTWRNAEARAQKLMADKDKALQAVKDQYGPALQQANLQASEAQKAYLDSEAAEALLDRPDGAAIAEALGLTLPE